MIESTNTTELELVAVKGKVIELEQKLAWAQEARDNYGKLIDQIRNHIQASIDREEWSDEELDEIFWEELAEMLDLEISKTVEVIIKAEWTATLKLKRTKDLDDVEISVEEPEVSSFSSEELSDVYERRFEVIEA